MTATLLYPAYTKSTQRPNIQHPPYTKPHRPFTHPLLHLSPQQIRHHLTPRDSRGRVKRSKVEGGEHGVCQSEWEHGGDPSCAARGGEVFSTRTAVTGEQRVRERTDGVFQCPAFIRESVLLDFATLQVMDRASGVDLPTHMQDRKRAPSACGTCSY